MSYTTKYLYFMFSVSLAIFVTQPSFAASEITPYNAVSLPIGSGARALGLGGAFIAVADDATAASWNPGGLIQLERPELSVVGSFLSTQQDFSIQQDSFISSIYTEPVSRGDLNFASVAYPFRVCGKDVVATLNYQQINDFHTQMEIKIDFNDKFNFESRGGIGALTPAFSTQIAPRVSMGVAVNYYTDEYFGGYAWEEVIKGRLPSNGQPDIARWTFKNFQAINVTTGLLWDVWKKENKRLTFGAVYDTPYTADVNMESKYTQYSFYYENNKKIEEYKPIHESNHLSINYPMSLGAGLGFRYSDRLSFSSDVTWTDWSEFEQEQEDEHGRKTRPLGSETPADRDIDDTFAVRCGTEYLIFRQKYIVPVRGGLFYEPRPSLDDPTDVYGFSVGSGITFDRFSLDYAYQFRRANNVDGEDFGFPGTQFDLTEHLFLASVIVYF